MTYKILESGSIEDIYKGFYCIEEKGMGDADLTRLNENVWFFSRLFVRENLRGNGMGTALLKKVVDFCKCNNITLINCINPYGNLDLNQLKQFYIKNGFIETPLKDTVILLRDGGCMKDDLELFHKSI